MPSKVSTSAVLAILAALAGCATAPQTAQRSPVETAPSPGTRSAIPLGPVLGGRRDRSAAAAGAGVAAIAAASTGGYMDRLERDLRAREAGSGVTIVRKGDEIDLRMASAISFDFNAATVKTAFRTSLNKLGQTLAAYPSTFIDITGHSDAVGTDSINQALSEQRARAIAAQLGSLGVNPARIAARGYGRQFPIASNDTEAGRAENRRVEIHLSPVTDQDYRQLR